MIVVFYVSGHGFGHASRAAELITELARRQPDARFAVRTSARRKHFEALPRVEVEALETDTGVVQIDSLRLDEEESARRAARFYADFEAKVESEARHLARTGASIVLADIPPLATVAAARAGIPAIAVGNFTWDWIYAGYPAFDRLAPSVIPIIRTAYAGTTRALRLPMHGGFEPMAAVTDDVPFIARRSVRDPFETRRALGLTDPRPIVLASFGGHGVRLPYEEVARDGRLTVLTADDTRRIWRGPAHPSVRRLGEEEMRDLGLRYEDLVAAADAVVTKPGYGIISECIANETAVLYTSRGHFVEYDVLVAELPRYTRCRFIDQTDLMAGRWADAVEGLLGQPPPPVRAAVNGAAVAAEMIWEVARQDRAAARPGHSSGPVTLP